MNQGTTITFDKKQLTLILSLMFIMMAGAITLSAIMINNMVKGQVASANTSSTLPAAVHASTDTCTHPAGGRGAGHEGASAAAKTSNTFSLSSVGGLGASDSTAKAVTGAKIHWMVGGRGADTGGSGSGGGVTHTYTITKTMTKNINSGNVIGSNNGSHNSTSNTNNTHNTNNDSFNSGSYNNVRGGDLKQYGDNTSTSNNTTKNTNTTTNAPVTNTNILDSGNNNGNETSIATTETNQTTTTTVTANETNTNSNNTFNKEVVIETS